MTTKEAKSISKKRPSTPPAKTATKPIMKKIKGADVGSSDLDTLKKEEFAGDEEENNTNTNSNTTATPPPQKDRKESRREQKQLIKERKSERPMAAIISSLKPSFEIIRQKNVAASTKAEAIQEALLISKKNLKDLSLRREGSRIVQSLVQYSSKDQRSCIINELKSCLLDLSQSTYGMFVLKKCLKEDPNSKDVFIASLKGSLPQFLKFKNSASFINDLYLLIPSPSKKTAFVAELYSREYSTPAIPVKFCTLKDFVKEQPAKREVVLASLKKLVTSRFISREGMIRLPVIQRLLNDYLSIETKAELLAVLPRLLPQIEVLLDSVIVANADANTGGANGNAVVVKEQQQKQQQDDVVPQIISRLFSYASAKERKAILKGLKKNFAMLLGDWNLSLIVITIICQQDDTVLLGKVMLDDLLSFLKNSSQQPFLNKTLYRIIMLIISKERSNNIMTPQTNLFLKEAILPYSSSKKEMHQRREEIFEICSEGILEFLKDNYSTLKEGSCMWARNLLIEGHICYGPKLQLSNLKNGVDSNVADDDSNYIQSITGGASLAILKEVVKRSDEIAESVYSNHFEKIIKSSDEDICYIAIAMLRHPSLKDLIKGRRAEILPTNAALKKVIERLEE